MILIMKDIKIVKLDKYNSENYKEIAFSVYFNKKANNYCFAFEADEVNQYPLEDLLDQYNVSCTEYYGQKVTINNEEKNIVEVQTLSNKKNELIKLLNFSTIIDKEIINVLYARSELLALYYGISNFILNGNKIEVPIVAYRNDYSGLTNFEVKYPEIQYKAMFNQNKEYNIELENFDVENIKYILLQDRKAKLVYDKDNKYYEAIFNLNGYENTNII